MVFTTWSESEVLPLATPQDKQVMCYCVRHEKAAAHAHTHTHKQTHTYIRTYIYVTGSAKILHVSMQILTNLLMLKVS